MGNCCQSETLDAQEQQMMVQSNSVEEGILKERIAQLFNFKILLLGAGESGKSTVVKQLRLIHNKKPTKQELKTVGDSLHQNVIDCMKALLNAAVKFEFIDLLDEKDKETAEIVQNYEEKNRISLELGQAIVRLYESEAIKNTYAKRNEFWLLDSCNYYMKELERFTEIGFTPTEEDCVMARIRTTGIVVTNLEQKNPNPKDDQPDVVKFSVVDVGGQRNERKKWIHCFDDVKAILFIVNLAGYNQVLFEDGSRNRMKEALQLFHDIVRRGSFENTPIFLFLNKKDLFEIMVQKFDLANIFPDYDGGLKLQPALDYIEEAFRKQLPVDHKGLHINVVTGVVKKDIKYAFEEVKEKLFKDNQAKIEQERQRIIKESRRNRKDASGGCGCLC